jgi:hypothetical protein
MDMDTLAQTVAVILQRHPGLHTTLVQKLSLTYYTHNPLSIKVSLAGEKS